MAPSIEKQMSIISSMGKSEIIEQIQGFKGRVNLDFTQAYLNGQSVDKLRHILAAAIITVSK
ncbi:MAG: hypothetical protein KAJ07_11200 [Planctomycetes bacterium]|nr:hypothetical protein [Planctomycetota bacterium]